MFTKYQIPLDKLQNMEMVIKTPLDLINKIKFKDQKGYKPRLNSLFTIEEGVQFVFERLVGYTSDYKMRLLRIKNGRRIHDFIFLEQKNELMVDADSKDAILQFPSRTAITSLLLFLAESGVLYETYDRLAMKDIYKGKNKLSWADTFAIFS